MTQVSTLPIVREVGSLNADDLGKRIRINDGTIVLNLTVMCVTHVVDEATGECYTEVFDNPSRMFATTITSQATFIEVDT